MMDLLPGTLVTMECLFRVLWHKNAMQVLDILLSCLLQDFEDFKGHHLRRYLEVQVKMQ